MFNKSTRCHLGKVALCNGRSVVVCLLLSVFRCLSVVVRLLLVAFAICLLFSILCCLSFVVYLFCVAIFLFSIFGCQFLCYGLFVVFFFCYSYVRLFVAWFVLFSHHM